jgi:hypothetical protein
MENFVHILTYNGIKIAFKNMDQVNEFIDKNKMTKVHIMSIQYYKNESAEKGE